MLLGLAASAKGYLEIALLLIQKGANINVQGGQYGNTIQAASAGGYLKITEILLQKGVNTNT